MWIAERSTKMDFRLNLIILFPERYGMTRDKYIIIRVLSSFLFLPNKNNPLGNLLNFTRFSLFAFVDKACHQQIHIVFIHAGKSIKDYAWNTQCHILHSSKITVYRSSHLTENNLWIRENDAKMGWWLELSRTVLSRPWYIFTPILRT